MGKKYKEFKALATECAKLCNTNVINVNTGTELYDAGFDLQNGISVQVVKTGEYNIHIWEEPMAMRDIGFATNSDIELKEKIKELYSDLKFGFIGDVDQNFLDEESGFAFRIMLKEHLLRSYNYNDEFKWSHKGKVENLYETMKKYYPSIEELMEDVVNPRFSPEINKDAFYIQINQQEYLNNDSKIEFFMNQQTGTEFYMQFTYKNEIKTSFTMDLNDLINYSLCHGVSLANLNELVLKSIEAKQNIRKNLISSVKPLEFSDFLDKVKFGSPVERKNTITAIREVANGIRLSCLVDFDDGSLEGFFFGKDYDNFKYGLEYTKASFAYESGDLNKILKERGILVIDDDKHGNVYVGLSQENIEQYKNANTLIELCRTEGVEENNIPLVYSDKFDGQIEKAYECYLKDSVSAMSKFIDTKNEFAPTIDECLQQIEEEETAKQKTKSPNL